MNYLMFWAGRPYSPYLMKAAVDATVFGLPKVFPSSIKQGVLYWENGIVNYFYPEKQFDKTVDDFIKKSLKSTNLPIKFFLIALNGARQLRIFSEKYPSSRLKKMSDKQLVVYLQSVAKKFEKFYSYATLAPLIGYRDDNEIYSRMDKILKTKIKNNPELFAEYLADLTTSPKRLIIHDQELAILKIAKLVKKNNLKTKKQIEDKFFKQIEKIQKDFGWLSFDFCNKITWDFKHYSKLIFDKLKKDINKEIRDLNNYEKNTQNKFNKICKQLKITSKEKEIFQFIRNLGYYKWAREYEFQEALYNAKLAQDELAKRFNFTTLESKYFFSEELEWAIKNPKEAKKLAQKRLKNFLVLVDKNRCKTYVGAEAKNKFKKIKFVTKNVKIKNLNELLGTPAQTGKVKGIVKIVNEKNDLIKMKKGNILVSAATSPELLSGMKKAAAIVTDEGGITCHAAIVARELKTPCVIGTKIATKVLKDGDRVEVDATKGIVKKI